MPGRLHAAVLLAAGVLALPVPLASAEELAGPYSAQVLRIIDGDTFEARIHVFLGQENTVLVRLAGIDAPELRGRCPEERAAATVARDHLAVLLGSGPVLLSALRRDKYGGRVIATVRLPSGEDIGAALLAPGHARPATKGRGTWCPP